MAGIQDGPSSSWFEPVSLRGNVAASQVGRAGLSKEMAAAAEHMPRGACVSWGIPYRVSRPVVIRDAAVTVKIAPTKAPWFVVVHTSDRRDLPTDEKGLVIPPMRGIGRLGEHAADYVFVYADGSEQRVTIRRRHEIGAFQRPWGENCFEAVAHHKPYPLGARPSDVIAHGQWGRHQTRSSSADHGGWVNWLWAWENPSPRKAVTAIRFEPLSGTLVVSGLAAGKASAHPLRWPPRRKAVLTLPKKRTLDGRFDERGRLGAIALDMGQVISVALRPVYPDRAWARSDANAPPEVCEREVLVEYTAHPDARFHLAGGRTLAVARLQQASSRGPLTPIAPATQRVTLRVVDRASRTPVPVKLHVHGAAGEYLAPIDRHRIVNDQWFQDYSVDFSHRGRHPCTYIPGETVIELPIGRVFVEVTKGFEIRPVRRVVRVTRGTREVTIQIEKVLPWRERGWVSADTHVHFLSTNSALLEGAGEGVNVVNLLASQWGELMTNVGDLDAQNAQGTQTVSGDGEYVVRVGTENRQHVLGHISLLGYDGRIIAPMTTGGPDESAIGDPIDVLLSEWARRCKAQNGVVVLPHFPNPRAENAAAIVAGDIDALEMTSWGDFCSGISPYSLSDWYRYLNCGYFVAAVGGTDKMSASTAVGTVRTYAQLDGDQAFTYEAWKQAIRRGRTFVTSGPLMEVAVDGHAPGDCIRTPAGGGAVEVLWRLASVTVPMTRVELIVNGEVRDGQRVRPDEDTGHFRVRLSGSSWVALLVRGQHKGRPEMIAAHSSPVRFEVAGSPFAAAADALTILEQIEGALAYLDTVGTRAETAAYKRMRMVLTAAHRSVHNRMHQMGQFHQHSPTEDHPEHH